MKTLKENLNAKLKKQGGFTLVEMLIVVAIIAILIAISIPLVNGALEKARDATDEANIRAAKAETLLHYMGVTTDTFTPAGGSDPYKAGAAITFANKVYYNAKDGSLTTTLPKGYGKCSGCGNVSLGKSGTDGSTAETASTAHTDLVLQVMIDTNGVFSWAWVTGATS